MRPSRRGFFVRAAFAAGVALSFFSAGRPARANEQPVEVRAPDDEDEAEFKKSVVEIEEGLNEILQIDEDKKIHIKKEFREGLPMPAEQVERMLQMTVRIDEEGKLRLRNPEQIRPFMGQIKGFLKMGGAGKLKELAKKTPEERKAELEKLVRPGGDDKDEKKHDEKKHEGGEKKRVEERKVEKRPDEKKAEKVVEKRDGNLKEIEERLARLEQRMERVTRALEDMARNRAQPPATPTPPRATTPRPGAQPENRWRAEPWGWRGEPQPHPDREGLDRRAERKAAENDRRRAEGERSDERRREERRHDDRRAPEFGEGRRRHADERDRREGGDEIRKIIDELRRELQKYFNRDRDERDRDDRDEDRGGRRHREERDERRDDRRGGRGERGDRDGDFMGRAGELREGARDMVNGLRKLNEVMTPEDRSRIVKMLGKLSKELKPEDLREQQNLMEKVQKSIDPEDLPRMMEIGGEFLGSPEGQAFRQRLEKTIRRFEEFRQEDGGKRLEDGLKRMNGLFGRGEKGEGNGLGKGIEKLFPRKEEPKHEAPKHEKSEKDRRDPTRSPKSRLY